MAATRTIREIGPKARLWLALAAGALILVVAAKIAYYRMFTGFAVTDDEGYFLLSIKGVIAHGGLYDAVYSQYGPFYYDLFGGLFSVLGIAVGHDAGRWMVAVIWLAATALGAVAAYRITGSLVLGLFSEVLVFRTLGVNAADPMHPGA